MRLARASCSRASVEFVRHRHFPLLIWFGAFIAFYRLGDQPAGASSKPSKEKPGATVQPTSVQSPRHSAACQARAGTVTCGASPAWISAPSRMISSFGAVDDFELERRAGVIVPDLDGVDAVPVRALAARQQEIDRGRGGAAVDHAGIAEGLAVVAAFGMRLEIERADDVGGGERGMVADSELVLARADFGEHLRRPACRPCRCRPRPPADRRAGTDWPASRRRW